jgi:hypothetical protein
MQSGAGQLGRGLAQGPRQIQAILARLQARMEEQRLQAELQAERDAPVDVQVLISRFFVVSMFLGHRMLPCRPSL